MEQLKGGISMNKNYSRTVQRTHTTLSNGQHAAMYVMVENPEGYYAHYVGLCIGNTKRQCNDWWQGRQNRRVRSVNLKSTGKCGIEGLVWALNQLLDLEKRLTACLKDGNFEVIVIAAEDNKRASAYERLKKYGYQEASYNGADVLVKVISK
jgi:hypothetical protein